MIQVSLHIGQQFPITVRPVPANGTLDAPPVYTSDTPGVVTIAPAADGLSAEVMAQAPGTATITVSGKSLLNTIAGDDAVEVTVLAPPPPPPVAATALHVTVGQVS